MRASVPPAECMLCHREFDAEDLQDHLETDHDKEELAEYIVSIWEEREGGQSV